MSKRAFTLIEVLIAIALLVVIVGAMFGFLFDMLETRARGMTHVARQRAAAALIERLEIDLSACIVGDRSSGAGVRGDQSQLRVLTRGVLTPLALPQSGADEARVLGDLQVAEYRFNESSGQIEGRRAASILAGSTLPAFSPLQGEIARVRFRFHDGTAWRDSFDSLVSDRLPVAVEVAVWFNRPIDAAEPGAEETDPAPNADSINADLTSHFDDQAYAAISDLAAGDQRSPDRRRVIVVPDGGRPRGSSEDRQGGENGPETEM